MKQKQIPLGMLPSMISGYSIREINQALRNGQLVLANPVNLTDEEKQNTESTPNRRIIGIKQVKATKKYYGRLMNDEVIEIWNAWPEY